VATLRGAGAPRGHDGARAGPAGDRATWQAVDDVLAEHFIEHNRVPGNVLAVKTTRRVLQLWRTVFPDLTPTVPTCSG
jgi:hypothetical protein